MNQSIRNITISAKGSVEVYFLTPGYSLVESSGLKVKGFVGEYKKLNVIFLAMTTIFFYSFITLGLSWDF